MTFESLFTKHWREVPTVWVDFETTGTRIGIDRAVEVGFARFAGGVCTEAFSCRVNPGMPIPPEAIAVHGITDADVAKAPTLAAVIEIPMVRNIVAGAQPAAYNAPFDRNFCSPLLTDLDWPWLDALSVVRMVDRYAKGKGRHRLAATCERHGIELARAHSAVNDARASGELFYKLADTLTIPGKGSIANWTMGQLLCWQGIEEKREWYRFFEWKTKQPPMEPAIG